MAWCTQMGLSILAFFGLTGELSARVCNWFGRRKKMALLFGALLLGVPLLSNADSFSNAQIRKARQAYHLAGPYGLEWTFSALVYQESSLCANKKGIDPQGLGCTQIHLQTARLFFPDVTIQQLETDDTLNMLAGLSYLKYCKKVFKDWASTLVCYKRGEPTARSMSYEQRQIDPYPAKIRVKMLELMDLRTRKINI